MFHLFRQEAQVSLFKICTSSESIFLMTLNTMYTTFKINLWHVYNVVSKFTI